MHTIDGAPNSPGPPTPPSPSNAAPDAASELAPAADEPRAAPRPVKSPRQILDVLVRLQRLDQGRDRNVSLIRTGTEVSKTRAQDVEKKRAELKKAEEELIVAKKAAAVVELDLKTKAADIQKHELQLNTAKTNQEYQALLGHIQKMKAEVSREEDTGLAAYERIAECEKKVARARGVLTQAEAELKDFEQACSRDAVEARGEIATTEPRRAELLAELTDELRGTYERIRAAREGVAVVPLDGRCCGGCGVNVTPNEIAKLLSASSIVTCKSCQRILYSPAVIS